MKCTICTPIKDEQKFLKEWIDWNFKLGFDDIHLFEDFGSKPHKDITDSYPNVHLHDMSEINFEGDSRDKQLYLYNWFIAHYKDEYDWCAFIDVDEFIQFDEGYNLSKLCNDFIEYNGVELWWKWYGSNGYIESPNLPVQVAYHDDYCPHMENTSLYEYKTFFNFKKGKVMMHVHRCPCICNTNFEIHSIVKPVRCYKKCWIDHYRIKSLEDFKQSLIRGNCTPNLRKMSLYYKSLKKE